MSTPAAEAAVARAPLSRPPRLHTACIEERMTRFRFSCTPIPTTFWATSTTASQTPATKRHAAIIHPLTDHGVSAAAATRATVPPRTTGLGPKRAMRRAGSTEERTAPRAKQETTSPNSIEFRPSLSTSWGYHGRRPAKAAPFDPK